MKFLSAIVLITYGVGMYYGGQLLMEERAKNEIATATASFTAGALKAQQDDINRFIAAHK